MEIVLTEGEYRMDSMELIAAAPWREAVTYRETWPHEYVVINRDGQHKLLASFCERIRRGEGVECLFFSQRRKYVKGGPKLDQSGGGKLDHPAARWRV